MQQPVYQNPKIPSIEQVYRTNLILWAAMLMAQIMLLVMLFFTKKELFNFNVFAEPVTVKPIIGIFAVLGMLTFALSFILKNRFLRLAVKNQTIGMAQTGQILAYALCEGTSLLGVAVAFAFGFPYFFLWFVVGILGILIHFPRRDNFIAAGFKGINLNG